MKKILLCSVIACLFLFSCKKEKSATGENTPSSKKYAVNFSVSDFSQTITGDAVVKNNAVIKNRTDASVPTDNLADAVSILYYYVYDSNGNFLHKILQNSTTANFGKFTDSLASGTYTVLFAGGQTGLSVTTIENQLNILNDALLTYSTNIYETTPTFNPWKDTFFKKDTVTISGADVNQTIALNRIVSKIEVKLEDAIPTLANSIVVSFSKEYAGYGFSSNSPITPTFSYTSTTIIPAASKGTTNYTISTIINNTVAPINVTIKSYDVNNNLLAQATINNISCQKNVATVLSGKLFDLNNSFQVSLNTAWDSTPITIHY